MASGGGYETRPPMWWESLDPLVPISDLIEAGFCQSFEELEDVEEHNLALQPSSAQAGTDAKTNGDERNTLNKGVKLDNSEQDLIWNNAKGPSNPKQTEWPMHQLILVGRESEPQMNVGENEEPRYDDPRDGWENVYVEVMEDEDIDVERVSDEEDERVEQQLPMTPQADPRDGWEDISVDVEMENLEDKESMANHSGTNKLEMAQDGCDVDDDEGADVDVERLDDEVDIGYVKDLQSSEHKLWGPQLDDLKRRRYANSKLASFPPSPELEAEIRKILVRRCGNSDLESLMPASELQLKTRNLDRELRPIVMLDNLGHFEPSGANADRAQIPIFKKPVKWIEYTIKTYKNMTNPTFHCTYCNKKLHNETSIYQHILDSHRPKDINCRSCEELFSSCNSRNIHMVKTHQQLIGCPSCGLKYKHARTLCCHVQERCKSNNFLSGMTPAKQRLQLEYEELKCRPNPIHNRLYWRTPKILKEFKCNQCGQVCTNASQLYHHVYRHKGITHCCQQCGKVYVSRKNYKNHLKSKHPNQSIPCRKCEATFSSIGELVDHEFDVHPTAKN